MMSHLWSYLQGLPMTSGEQRWLADRLLAASEEKQVQKHDVTLPRLPKDFMPSAEVLALSCGPLPEGFDVDKELEKMWEELAQ
ncbi:MAG: hypothetical protein J6W88_01880 [Bacteroidales bacterium]|nr:hypothetical protein [Bacteroidales bacterium]